MRCPNCSAPMQPLFTSWACTAECDLRPQPAASRWMAWRAVYDLVQQNGARIASDYEILRHSGTDRVLDFGVSVSDISQVVWGSLLYECAVWLTPSTPAELYEELERQGALKVPVDVASAA